MDAAKSVTLVMLLLVAVVAFPLSISVAQASHSYMYWVRDYRFTPYIDSNPHGRLNVIVDIYKILNDHSSSRDWYFYHVQIQSVPGTVSYNSDWETSNHLGNHDVWNPGTYRWLADYDPTTTDGFTTSTVSASITISNRPAATFSYSDSYQIPYVKVIDQSDYSLERARWLHDFNEGGDPGGSPSDSTYKARPWFAVRTTQDAWSFVDGSYSIQFGHQAWSLCWHWLGFWYFCYVWVYQDFSGSVKFLDARRSGDS